MAAFLTKVYYTALPLPLPLPLLLLPLSLLPLCAVVQDRCIEVMYSHRKNDVYAVLDFALRFNLPRLQGSCLALLSQVSRGRLVDSAERVVRVRQLADSFA